MVTYNRIIMDLCSVCGVEVGDARISERRARELIRMCTDKIRETGVHGLIQTTLEGDHPMDVLLKGIAPEDFLDEEYTLSDEDKQKLIDAGFENIATKIYCMQCAIQQASMAATVALKESFEAQGLLPENDEGTPEEPEDPKKDSEGTPEEPQTVEEAAMAQKTPTKRAKLTLNKPE